MPRNPQKHPSQKYNTPDSKHINPFFKENPYHVKAKFYSTDKKHSSNDPGSNPQAYKYKRGQKENYYSSTSGINKPNQRQSLLQYTNKLSMMNREFKPSGSAYKQSKQYQQYVIDHFCPSDAYLTMIKDKIGGVTDQSSFQKVMRMSNITLSRLPTKDEFQYKKKKENPFYRKNLLSTQRYQYGEFEYEEPSGINSWKKYLSLSGPHDDPSDFDSSLPLKYHLNNYLSNPSQNQSDFIEKYQYSQMQRQPSSGSKNSPKISLKDPNINLEVSFGMKQGKQHRKALQGILDMVIERPAIEERAPKTMQIKGKRFHLNHVQLGAS